MLLESRPGFPRRQDPPTTHGGESIGVLLRPHGSRRPSCRFGRARRRQHRSWQPGPARPLRSPRPPGAGNHDGAGGDHLAPGARRSTVPLRGDRLPVQPVGLGDHQRGDRHGAPGRPRTPLQATIRRLPWRRCTFTPTWTTASTSSPASWPCAAASTPSSPVPVTTWCCPAASRIPSASWAASPRGIVRLTAGTRLRGRPGGHDPRLLRSRPGVRPLCW